jgi:cell division septation protein DedD
MVDAQDTEITLGTGRLLGLFFGLVIVCALFFGLGFSLGRSSAKSGPITMEETPAAASPAQTSEKTLAGTPQKAAPAPADPSIPDSNAAQATNQAPPPVVTSPAATTSATPPPEMERPAGGGYAVQVAAVSKQEDAEALIEALRKKSYPVFLANAGTDKLFHVQVGPFNDIKEAEAVKARLTGDGYNPIVKR